MQTAVDQENWQGAIHYVIDQALPSDDYQVVCFHQSKSSESLYVDILFENYLYQFRFAFHNHDDENPNLYSFNLRAYPQDRQLIRAIHLILKRRHNGVALTYPHFVTLPLVEKLGQFHDTPLLRHDELFWEREQVLHQDGLEDTLKFLWQHQLLLIKHATGQLYLSDSGEKLLNYYWDVADQYLEDPSWDNNPRTNTPDELRAILNS